jgi:hypothetical protein
MAKYIIIGDGFECPKCNKAMQRREHKEMTPKILSQPYYFAFWDCCTPCRHMQHYEEAKVYNKNKKGEYFKNVDNVEQEATLLDDLSWIK